MLSRTLDFDWSQARAFWATAEAGSFSGGARTLGLTQPTLSRQVAALEDDLGVTLFERIGNTLQLTETGLDLLDHVRSMAKGAEKVVLAASGRAAEVAGQVTITATDVVATFLLPPALRRIRDVAPGISIDILATNAVQDLRRREADISVRHVRPTEPDLVARSMGEATAYLYAASDYLDRIGRPTTMKEAEACADFLHFGFADFDEFLVQFQNIGVKAGPESFRLGSMTPLVTWEYVRQGFGMALMMSAVGDATPGVERVVPDMEALTFPCWLVTHREVHTSKRIRLVFDILAETLGPHSKKRQ